MRHTKIVALLGFIIISFSFCSNTPKDAAEQSVENDKNKNEQFLPDQQPKIMKEDLSGKVIMLNDEEFIQRITEINNPKGFQYKGTTPCIIDFYADWCRPCVGLSSVMVEVAEQYKGKIIIYKLNVDKSGDVVKAIGIESIPTLLFMKKNGQPAKMVGAPQKEELLQAINDLLLSEE